MAQPVESALSAAHPAVAACTVLPTSPPPAIIGRSIRHVYMRRPRTVAVQDTCDAQIRSHVRAFLASLSEATSGLLPCLVSHKRGSKVLPPDFAPRRSGRLAKGGKGAPNSNPKHLQAELVQRLGNIGDVDSLRKDVVIEFERLLLKPMYKSQVDGLASFFGWCIPDHLDEEVVSMLVPGRVEAVV